MSVIHTIVLYESCILLQNRRQIYNVLEYNPVVSTRVSLFSSEEGRTTWRDRHPDDTRERSSVYEKQNQMEGNLLQESLEKMIHHHTHKNWLKPQLAMHANHVSAEP